MADFLGQYTYSLDEKGRVSMPARFRRLLTPEARETFVITSGLDACLFVYPLDVWERKSTLLRDLPISNSRSRKWVRWVASSAVPSTCDSQGRITVPPHLLRWAKLEKETLISGALDRIEIWNPAVFAAYTAGIEDEFEELAEDVLF